MTLRKQLLIIIAALFVLLFIGTFSINVHNTRAYLNDQLRTISQDMATSLAITVAPHMETEDLAMAESYVSALYDSGYYQEIIIVNTDNKTLIERSQEVSTENVPQWFVKLFPLETPVGESLITTGWTQAGAVYISANPEFAYTRLWTSTIQSFFWFTGSFIILFALCILVLHYVLRPLRAVEEQAEAISNKNYVIQTRLPWTLELRRVVEAMNQMSARIRSIFDEQEASLERIRNAAYTDNVTGLANRSYFMMQLKNMIESPDDIVQGAILFLEVSHLQQINQQEGQKAGDALLHGVRDMIEHALRHYATDESLAARLSGSTFAIAIKGITEEEARAFGQSLADKLPDLHQKELTPYKQVGHIGMTMFRHQGMQNLLSEVDMALRAAQIAGQNTMHYHKAAAASEFDTLTATQWIALLRRVIERQQCTLLFQSIQSLSNPGKILHHEVLLRIADDQGKLIPAGIFIPMVHHHGFTIDVDKMVIREVLRKLELPGAPEGSVSINLSPISIRSPEFMTWITQTLASKPALGSRLVFELSDYAVSTNRQAVQVWSQHILPTRARLAIDHFGRSLSSLTELNTLNLAYIKIDGSFIRGIDENRDNQQFVGSLINMAHSHEVDVIAESVETAAEQHIIGSLGMDGAQGYAIHRPTVWD